MDVIVGGVLSIRTAAAWYTLPPGLKVSDDDLEPWAKAKCSDVGATRYYVHRDGEQTSVIFTLDTPYYPKTEVRPGTYGEVTDDVRKLLRAAFPQATIVEGLTF